MYICASKVKADYLWHIYQYFQNDDQIIYALPTPAVTMLNSVKCSDVNLGRQTAPRAIPESPVTIIISVSLNAKKEKPYYQLPRESTSSSLSTVHQLDRRSSSVCQDGLERLHGAVLDGLVRHVLDNNGREGALLLGLVDESRGARACAAWQRRVGRSHG